MQPNCFSPFASVFRRSNPGMRSAVPKAQELQRPSPGRVVAETDSLERGHEALIGRTGPAQAVSPALSPGLDALSPQALARVVWPERRVAQTLERGLAPALQLARSVFPRADLSQDNVARQVARAMEETGFLRAYYTMYADTLSTATLSALARIRPTALGHLVFDRYEVLCGGEGVRALFGEPTGAGEASAENLRAAAALTHLTHGGVLSEEKKKAVAKSVACSFTSSELKTLEEFFSESSEGRAYANFLHHSFQPSAKVVLDTNVITRANDLILGS